MEEQKGRIIKGVGGLYDVLCGKKVVQCRARGALRHERITPYIGDNVIFENGYILDITERKNALVRPPIANLDILFIVAAAIRPNPVTLTVDKLISIAEFMRIEPVIIITKNDLDSASATRLEQIYRTAGFDVFVTDPQKSKSELIDFFYNRCFDRMCAFAGASGVGKSTLLNSLFPSLSLETGELSRKISRGRHTTRHIQLYPLSELTGDSSLSGFIADTPGFSMLDASSYENYNNDELPYTFREFVPYIGKCRYTGCTHTKEEGCAVLDAVSENKISSSRHESFLAIYESLKNKHAWDK